jgi:hypothetical protein
VRGLIRLNGKGGLMSKQILPWILFNIFVLAMLALDLGVFRRDARVVKI